MDVILSILDGVRRSLLLQEVAAIVLRHRTNERKKVPQPKQN